MIGQTLLFLEKFINNVVTVDFLNIHAIPILLFNHKGQFCLLCTKDKLSNFP